MMRQGASLALSSEAGPRGLGGKFSRNGLKVMWSPFLLEEQVVGPKQTEYRWWGTKKGGFARFCGVSIPL